MPWDKGGCLIKAPPFGGIHSVCGLRFVRNQFPIICMLSISLILNCRIVLQFRGERFLWLKGLL